MCFVFQENLRFLNFLKEPCEKLAEATPPEIPAILPELLNYVRCQLSMGSWAIASVQPVTCLVEHFPHCQSLLCSVCLPWHHQHWSVHICQSQCPIGVPVFFFSAGMIWSISTHYQKEDRISGLLRKMSNEIIKRCDLARWPTADHGRRWPELIRSWIWRSVAVGGCIVAFFMLAACSKQCTLVEVLVRPKGQSKAGLHKSAWLRISKRAYCLFPTSLCGVLVFGSALPPSPARPPPAHSSHTTCPHTHNLLTHNLLTHNLTTHNLFTHNLLTHTTWPHNLLTHNLFTHNLTTHNLTTHNLFTHNLSPHNLTTNNLLTHNLSTHNLLTHTQLTHAQLDHTHNLLTHNLTTRNLLTQLTHTQLDHTQLAHTTCHHTTCGRRGTWWHRPSLCVAGVALMALDWLWWRAWVSVWRRLVARLGLRLAPLSPRLLAWQAWHLVTSTDSLRWRGTDTTSIGTLRGRCGTWRHGRGVFELFAPEKSKKAVFERRFWAFRARKV